MKKISRIFHFVVFVFSCFFPVFSARGAVIFQDSFDNNCSGSACNSTGGWDQAPTGWEGWGQEGGTSATHDSVTHYSGEVASPGRGGSGKSLKLWRHSNSWEGYTGPLVKYFSGSYSDFYMRFYAKLPTALDINGYYWKLWRFNLSNGDEFYLNLNHPSSGSYRGQAALQLLSGGSGWVTLLNASQVLSLWDGQWHAWQFRFNFSTKTVTFWADGVQLSQVTLSGMSTGATFGTMMQHFPLGNTNGGSYWQNSWQAFEVDDLVFATTKAETDPVGGTGGDTTPPTSPTNLAATSPSQSSISVSWNPSTDNVGVTGYIVERCQGSGCSNFAQVGTPTSSPFVDSGLTVNTFYNYHVRAIDAAGNLSGWSNVVGATTQSATPAPAFTFTANPTSITSGSSSTLTWSTVTNATSCTASGGTFTGSKTTSGGTQSVSPTSTTTYTLSCTGTGGTTNRTATVTVSGGSSTLFFSEGYENTSFSSRGWYDITTGTLDTTEKYSGNSSLRCTYNSGGTSCTAPKRRKFTESNSVYIGYRVKYSANFVGSGQSYHPHEFLLLTNQNGDYDGLAFDYLTLYLESHWNSSSNGFITTGFQDGQNIDQTRINQNLIGVTENRSTAGCNGSPSGYSGDCYNRGDGVYVNGVMLNTPETFTSANKNNWNHVEAEYRLNTISGGIGQADGIIRMWFNDTLVFERTNAILRTGQHPAMKLNQFIFAPWIGDGSPVTQTMWLDDLEVWDTRPGTTLTPVLCNTVTTANFSQSAYNSYGAPFDAFQTSTNLMNTQCNNADTHTINLTTGVTGDTTRIVYTKGYWYDAVTTAWRQYTGTCTGALNGEWCQGSVSATITDPNVSTANAANPTYLVGMTCSVQGGSWKCGCRDTSCTNFSWQIQGAGQ